MRSRNCAFCPRFASRRSSNSLRSPFMMRAMSGSSLASCRSAGNATVSPSSRSASSRARRAVSSHSHLLTADRFACASVGSSRSSNSPASTRAPSPTISSPTTPPPGCCTFFTFDSTTSEPSAITAPATCVIAPSTPMLITRNSPISAIAVTWLRIEDCVSVARRRRMRNVAVMRASSAARIATARSRSFARCASSQARFMDCLIA